MPKWRRLNVCTSHTITATQLVLSLTGYEKPKTPSHAQGSFLLELEPNTQIIGHSKHHQLNSTSHSAPAAVQSCRPRSRNRMTALRPPAPTSSPAVQPRRFRRPGSLLHTLHTKNPNVRGQVSPTGTPLTALHVYGSGVWVREGMTEAGTAYICEQRVFQHPSQPAKNKCLGANS